MSAETVYITMLGRSTWALVRADYAFLGKLGKAFIHPNSTKIFGFKLEDNYTVSDPL